MSLSHPQNQNPQKPESCSNTLPKQIIWRRNCPYLYSLLYVNELDWPSLTVDWISAYQSETFKQDQQNAYNLVLGTQTDSEQNYILVAKTRIPNQKKQKKAKTDIVKKNDEQMPQKIQIMNRIPHEGEVNRIRHNPHEFTKVASKTTSGQIHIYSTSSKKDKVSPDLRLKGHESEGYAIEWNPNRNWFIISGSYDGKLSLWDSNKKQEGNAVTPLMNFSFHKKQIEDVSYNKFHESVFVSCDDEGITALWDSRNVSKAPVHTVQAHSGPQYGSQFSPQSEYIFLSGGSDSLVKVWDLRNLSSSLVECQNPGHSQITQVQWSRQNQTTAWSVSEGKATLWNLSTQKAMFVHACRSAEDENNPTRINQLSVNINQPDTLATVDSNNQIHIFQPNHNCKQQ